MAIRYRTTKKRVPLRRKRKCDFGKNKNTGKCLKNPRRKKK